MEADKAIDPEETGFVYNEKISEKEKHNPKHKLFLEWCFSNGLKWTGVDFPAYFGDKGELRGVVATRDINPYEIIMGIPNKLLMSSAKAKEDKALSKLFKKHEEIFTQDDSGDYNVLIVYLIRERLKGPESFFHPFLNLLDDIITGQSWDKKAMKFIEDPMFRGCIEESQLELESEWEAMKDVFEENPKLFPG